MGATAAVAVAVCVGGGMCLYAGSASAIVGAVVMSGVGGLAGVTTGCIGRVARGGRGGGGGSGWGCSCGCGCGCGW